MVRCVSTFRSQVWWYQYTGGCQLWQQPVKELKNLKNSNNDFYLSLIQKIPKFVLDFVHYDRALDVILLKRLCIIHQLIFSLITYETITIALHYIRNIGWWLVLGWQVRPANTNELNGWNVANMHTTHSFITTNWTKCLSFCFSFAPLALVWWFSRSLVSRCFLLCQCNANDTFVWTYVRAPWLCMGELSLTTNKDIALVVLWPWELTNCQCCISY